MKKIFLGCMLSIYSLSCATAKQEIGTVNTGDNSNINQTINYYNKDSYTHIINFAMVCLLDLISLSFFLQGK